MADLDLSGSAFSSGSKTDKKPSTPKKTKPSTGTDLSGSKFSGTNKAPAKPAVKPGAVKTPGFGPQGSPNAGMRGRRDPAFQKEATSSANALINTINAPAAYVAGAADESIRQIQQGKGFDVGSSLNAGNVNANAWKTTAKTVTTSNILIDRLGWDPNNPLTYVVGFAGDVILDPLNLAGAPISFGLKMAKAASKAADAGVDAIKLYNNGEQSINSAAAKQQISKNVSTATAALTAAEKARLSPAQLEGLGTEAGRITALETLGKKVTPEISARIQTAKPIPANLSKLPGAAGEKGAEAARKLADEYTFKTITITPDVAKATGFIDNFKGATAAALEAGSKQLKASILSDNAAKFMAKYAKRDRALALEVPTGKIAPRITSTLKTSVVKQGDEWVVRSGNKVTLAAAATKQEAEAIAKKLKSGESASLTSRATIQSIMGGESMEPTTIDALEIKPTTPGASAVTSILRNIQDSVTKISGATDKAGNAKKYTSLENVIDGLRLGDNINTNSLRDIITALDPEKRSLALAVKADNNGKGDYLAELLMNKGLESLSALKAKLQEAESFKQVARLKGIGYTEEVDAYVKAITDPAGLSEAQQSAILKASGIENPIESQTVEAAAARWVSESDRTKNITETATRDALALRNKRLDEVLASEEASRDISSLGDLVDFSSAMRLTDGSKAVLAEDLNIVFAKDVATKIFNFRRAEVVKAANAAENTGKYAYNPAKPVGSPAKIAKEHDDFAELMIDNFIKDDKANADYLLTMGKRGNNSKLADDKDFAKAYKKYGVDYNAADQVHTVYVGAGDAFEIFANTGAKDLIKKAFVPQGDPRTDAFLMMNFLDGVRNSMEQAGKAVVINQEEIVTRLLTRFKGVNKASSARKTEMRALATQMAEHLAKPEVQQALKEVHLQKVFGIVNDYAGKTSKVASDVFDSSRRLWLAASQQQTMSEFQKIALASQTMRDFFYASDIFKNAGGPVVETMFKSYGTMLLNGLDLDQRVANELMRGELELFTNQLQQYGKHARTVKAAPKGTVPTKQEQIAMNRVQIDLAMEAYEDAAVQAEKLFNAGAFKLDGKTDVVEEAIRAYQHMQLTALKKNTTLPPVRITTSNYEANRKNFFDPNRTNAEKNIIPKNAQGDPARMSKLQIRESRNKWQQVGSRQEDAIQYAHTNHIDVMSLSSEYASYLFDVSKKHQRATALAMDEAWDALATDAPPVSGNPESLSIYNDLKPIYEMLFGAKENNTILANGIDFNDVIEQFSKSGIKGMPSSVTAKGQSIEQFRERIPLGRNPHTQKTRAYDDFNEAKDNFAKSESSPFDIMSRFAYSVGVVKFKKGFIEDFFVNNSYRALDYPTLQSALDSKRFITPQLIGKDSAEFAKYIPTPENGGLVLPEAWDALGAALREFDTVLNDPFGPIMQNVMRFQGFMKANQTLLVPGFQFTTFIGDMGINLNLGVLNGAHYSLAGRLAGIGMKSDISRKSMFVRYDNKLESKLRNIYGMENAKVRSWEGSDAKVVRNPATDMYEVKNVRGEKIGSYMTEDEAKVAAIDKGEQRTTAFVIYKDGKPTRVKFSDQDLYDLMKSKGIIIDNIYAGNIQLLEDQLTLQEGVSTKASAMRKMGARIDRAYTGLLKTPGDVLAWQGNIPRVAQATKVMHSRAWASMDDALNAAAREIQLYHPTVQSLASSERKYGRAVISYYTWLRMATLATFDMAVKNPALVTMPNKFQYGISSALGNEPQNIGSAFEAEEELPSYLTGKTVGVNVSNPGGSFLIKPAFMQPSVLDAFSFMWNNNKSIMDNLWTGAGYNMTNIGGMTNQVVKSAIEIIQNRDEFGRATRDTPRQALDTLFSNFSISQLAKSFGYTPENKEPENTSNPLTDEERRIAAFNWLTRAGLTEYGTESQIKRYTQEQRELERESE
jgi:hypothetical protein